MRWFSTWVGLLALAAVAACKEDPKGLIDKVEGLQSSARKVEAPPPTVSAAKPTTMPELVVDNLGAYLGGKRVATPTSKEGRVALDEIVKALPVADTPTITLKADKKAKTPDVAAVVEAFGRAGASKVVVQTEGRADLPKELKLTPLVHVQTPPSCAIVAAVTEDLDTGVWPTKGGGGARHRKGWAGPDLTNTAKTVEKQLEQCESRTAFFSANAKWDWQLAFNVGGTIIQSDKTGKIDTLVLLGDEPVAGRKLEVEFKK